MLISAFFVVVIDDDVFCIILRTVSLFQPRNPGGFINIWRFD